MSSLDDKMPPDEPQSASVLDAMVQDHLERTCEGAASDNLPDTLQTQDLIGESGAVAESVDDHSAVLLHREIDLLLSGELAVHQEQFPADTAHGLAAAMPWSGQEANPPGNLAAAAILPNERQQVPSGADTGGGAPAGKGSPSEVPPVVQEVQAIPERPQGAMEASDPLAHEEVQEKLSEAEGVLAEELAHLVAEGKPGAARPDHTPVAATVGHPSTPDDAADRSHPPVPSAAASDPSTQASVGNASDLPVDTPDSRADGELAAADLSSLASEISADAAQAPVMAALEDDESVPAMGGTQLPRRHGPWTRIKRMASESVLMLAQALDLPFARLGARGKSMIGMAAWMLLLGGVVLWLVAFWLGLAAGIPSI